MSKTLPDKNEIVVRRAPRWAWQAVDMLLASQHRASIPYKAVRFASNNPDVSRMSFDEARSLLKREDPKMR